MRHQIGYIALSLLAAAFAGCSSADTGSSSTTNHEPLTGTLAQYNAEIVPLASGACTWTSVAATGVAAGTMTVLLHQKDVAQISIRAVDKAMLVNGQTCADTATTANKGIATSTLIKMIAVGSAVGGTDLDGTAETVIIDTRNGQFALAGTGTSAASTGIQIDLGAGSANDVVAISGSIAADKFGCSVVTSTGKDALGIKNATSKDVTFTNATPSTNMRYLIDLSDGNDQFDQNNCIGKVSVYGGLGNDIINVGASTSTGDLFSGGGGTDILSYAARTSTTDPLVINLSASAAGTSTSPWAPFAMASLRAGDSTEVDTLVDDFETITGSSSDDVILSGSQTSTYTLNGGPGNDHFATIKTYPAVMNGGAGIDTADYSGRASLVTATMAGGAVSGESGDTDNIALDVENFIGTNAGNTVTGSAANNVFFSGTGVDSFTGGAGDDTFMAAVTAGTSTDGNDTFIGGDGNDTIDYSLRTPANGYGVIIDLTGNGSSGLCAFSGTSTFTAGTVGQGDAETDTIDVTVENAVGTIGDDFITGNSNPNILLGFGGIDKILGLGGDDQIDTNKYEDASNKVCNPVTMTYVGKLTACTIVSGNTVKETAAIVDCGSDPLDIGTGMAGSSTFTGCQITQ